MSDSDHHWETFFLSSQIRLKRKKNIDSRWKRRRNDFNWFHLGSWSASLFSLKYFFWCHRIWEPRLGSQTLETESYDFNRDQIGFIIATTAWKFSILLLLLLLYVELDSMFFWNLEWTSNEWLSLWSRMMLPTLSIDGGRMWCYSLTEVN